MLRIAYSYLYCLYLFIALPLLFHSLILCFERLKHAVIRYKAINIIVKIRTPCKISFASNEDVNLNVLCYFDDPFSADRKVERLPKEYAFDQNVVCIRLHKV